MTVRLCVSDFVFRLCVFRRRFNPVFLPQNTPGPAGAGDRQRDAAALGEQDHLEAGAQTDGASQVVLLHGVGLQRLVRVRDPCSNDRQSVTLAFHPASGQHHRYRGNVVVRAGQHSQPHGHRQ